MNYPQMTEQQFFDWCDAHTFAEWVNGKVVDVPHTNTVHALMSNFLMGSIGTFVEENDLGTVLRMPYQMRFAAAKSRRLADLFFVSKEREGIFTEYHVEGPLDLICEIVTAESRQRDTVEKYQEYENAGVREYWVVDPDLQTVSMNRLAGPTATYQKTAEINGILSSVVLQNFFIKPTWLWRSKLPKVSDLLKEMAGKR